jgi:GTP cyclohydrolase I
MITQKLFVTNSQPLKEVNVDSWICIYKHVQEYIICSHNFFPLISGQMHMTYIMKKNIIFSMHIITPE